MWTNEVCNTLGKSKIEIGEMLGQTSGRITQWGDVVFEPSAARLHVLTGGKVIYDPKFYEHIRKHGKPPGDPPKLNPQKRRRVA